MGHERVGHLPRTERWTTIVERLPTSTAESSATVAEATLNNVRQRMAGLYADPGVQSAFQFLVALAQPSQIANPEIIPKNPGNISTVRICAYLHAFVDENTDSLEYAALAKQSASDAIAEWSRATSMQQSLFDDHHTYDVWAAAASGSGFSQIARLFFASFTERYIKYFLDREASAILETVEKREVLDRNLKNDIDRVTRHAFETSKITQSFAAGWYNKHARAEVPSRKKVRGFLAIAFGKIREELRCEAHG
jgi:hypothetical protein